MNIQQVIDISSHTYRLHRAGRCDWCCRTGSPPRRCSCPCQRALQTPWWWSTRGHGPEGLAQKSHRWTSQISPWNFLSWLLNCLNMQIRRYIIKNAQIFLSNPRAGMLNFRFKLLVLCCWRVGVLRSLTTKTTSRQLLRISWSRSLKKREDRK